MWNMQYMKKTMTIAVVSTRSNKQGWLGFGFSPNGGMKGADAVVGWDDGKGNSFIGDYFLAGQTSAKVTVTNKQELLNMKVIKKNGQTAILFDRPWEPADSVYVTDGPIHVILAAGALPPNTAEKILPYHTFRYDIDMVFIIKPGVKVLEVNGAKHRELCGGIEQQRCDGELKCVLFGQMEDFMSKVDKANSAKQVSSSSSFGGNSDSAPTPMSRNLFALGRTVNQNQGVCLNKMEVTDIAKSDIDKWTTSRSIDTSAYNRNIDLMSGIKLWWQVDFDSMSIKIAMTSRLPEAYFSFGFSPSGGMMVGSNVVLGWSDQNTTSNTNCKEYLLMGKLPWQVTESTNIDAYNFQVSRVDGEMSIEFERPLEPDNGMPITPGPNTILYAIGNQPQPDDEYFGYHRFRDFTDVVFYNVQDMPADSSYDFGR